MGNNISLQTVSQNSTGKDDPWVFNVENKESNALCQVSSVRRVRVCKDLQASYFKVLPVHDDVVESEQNREPESDYVVVAIGRA